MHNYINIQAQEMVYAGLIAWGYAIFGYRSLFIKRFIRRVKMKKIFCSLVIIMAITTAVSAQIIGDKYNLNAVPTISTEARYSAGRFGSYIDDFISVNDYDPAVKTFFFLGGFPASSEVNNTDNPSYDLSVGLGKSLARNSYLDVIEFGFDDSGKTTYFTVQIENEGRKGH
jgi:hypothetical protein